MMGEFEIGGDEEGDEGEEEGRKGKGTGKGEEDFGHFCGGSRNLLIWRRGGRRARRGRRRGRLIDVGRLTSAGRGALR